MDHSVLKELAAERAARELKKRDRSDEGVVDTTMVKRARPEAASVVPVVAPADCPSHVDASVWKFLPAEMKLEILQADEQEKRDEAMARSLADGDVSDGGPGGSSGGGGAAASTADSEALARQLHKREEEREQARVRHRQGQAERHHPHERSGGGGSGGSGGNRDGGHGGGGGGGRYHRTHSVCSFTDPSKLYFNSLRSDRGDASASPPTVSLADVTAGDLLEAMTCGFSVDPAFITAHLPPRCRLLLVKQQGKVDEAGSIDMESFTFGRIAASRGNDAANCNVHVTDAPMRPSRRGRAAAAAADGPAVPGGGKAPKWKAADELNPRGTMHAKVSDSGET
jgi:hypothetical protein